MPRDVYHQSAGNPLQLSRLPAESPVMEFPHRSAWDVSWQDLLRPWLGLQVVVVLTFILIQPYSRLEWMVFFALAVALVVVNVRQGITRVSLIEWLPCVVLACCLSRLHFLFTTPLTLAVILTWTLVVWSWRFGLHWLTLCTAAPLPPDKARPIRARLEKQLLRTMFIAAGLNLVALVERSWELWLFVNLGAIVCQFFLFNRDVYCLTKLRAIVDALVSWFTYRRDNAWTPGIARSAAGSWSNRVFVTVFVVYFTTVVVKHAYLQGLVCSSLSTTLDYDNFGLSLLRLVALIAWTSLQPLAVAILLPVLWHHHVLVSAERYRRDGVRDNNWNEFVSGLRQSPIATESQSLYIGRLVADHSPLLVPRSVFYEHAHFLGDSGSGKTSLGLAPTLEQLIEFGDCSFLVIDLKADSMELLATVAAAAERTERRRGQKLPVKQVSIQSDLSTYGFNLLGQSYWQELEDYPKTDILCGAFGLSYGTDYGAGFYSSANAYTLNYLIRNCPDAKSFRDLSEGVRSTLQTASKRDLNPDLRTAGSHIQAVLDRLSAFDFLNVTPSGGFDPDVVREAIDLRDLFLRPQIVYAHLSCTLAGGSSPEIARLLAYALLCGATQTKRKHRVFLVVDEFQRMAAHNVEYMLQLARSMGVGLILANQSMQDLGDLITAVEANCRYRQWFSVSSLDDRMRLSEASGEVVEQLLTETWSRKVDGSGDYSVSSAESVMARLSKNEIALVSDHPFRSIVTLTRGAGFAQYGGFPVIVESAYHITAEEYERRKTMSWPEATGGAFIPRDHRRRNPVAPVRKPGVSISTEILPDFAPGGLPPFPQPPRGRFGRGSFGSL